MASSKNCWRSLPRRNIVSRFYKKASSPALPCTVTFNASSGIAGRCYAGGHKEGRHLAPIMVQPTAESLFSNEVPQRPRFMIGVELCLFECDLLQFYAFFAIVAGTATLPTGPESCLLVLRESIESDEYSEGHREHHLGSWEAESSQRYSALKRESPPKAVPTVQPVQKIRQSGNFCQNVLQAMFKRGPAMDMLMLSLSSVHGCEGTAPGGTAWSRDFGLPKRSACRVQDPALPTISTYLPSSCRFFLRVVFTP